MGFIEWCLKWLKPNICRRLPLFLTWLVAKNTFFYISLMRRTKKNHGNVYNFRINYKSKNWSTIVTMTLGSGLQHFEFLSSYINPFLEVTPYIKRSYFCKLFCVHSYSSKDAKVDQGVHLLFSFPTNIVSNKVKKYDTK